MGVRTELTVRVPGDKSVSQRALLLAAVAAGESRVRGMLRSADPMATGRAVRALGTEILGLRGSPEEFVLIRGKGLRSWRQPPNTLDLRNSGTGVRLLAGALAAQPLTVVLDGDASLRRRPMERIVAPLRKMGATVSYLRRPGLLPLRIEGGALGATAYESPVASAQVKSAVLLAGVGAGVETLVSEPRRSRDHTERMLEAMGAAVHEEERDGRWFVRVAPPVGELAPLDMQVPADLSSAAFFLALAALSEGLAVAVPDVGLSDTRTGFLCVLERMGARVQVVRRGSEGGEPVGEVRVIWTGRVAGDRGGRRRSSGDDRRNSAFGGDGGARRGRHADRRRGGVAGEGIGSLGFAGRQSSGGGVQVDERPDGLEIEGTRRSLSASVRSFGDHRVAMAFGILGATPGCEFRIDDPTVADVSFPGFWKLLAETTKRAASGRSALAGRSPAPAPVRRPPRRPVPARAAPAELDRPELAGPAHEARGRPGRSCVVVAIDGPAGAGKSTTARAVARALGFRHLDSGALYRVVTLALLDSGPSAENLAAIAPADVAEVHVSAGWDGDRMHVFLDGERVADEAIRAARVNALVSQVSAAPAVRARLMEVQREAAQGPGLVADGRDMGTVVFPDAQVKVFLVADVRERARRRLFEEGVSDPGPAQVSAEAARLAERDRLDASRQAAPLARAADATPLDTTAMDFDAQVDAIVDLVRGALDLDRDAGVPEVTGSNPA